MELTILGSGTYQPELKRHCSSYLLKIEKQILVFDFGRGTLDGLLKEKIHYYDIDCVFISHTHPDHFSELASLLHISLAEPETGKFRKKDLVIYGPAGFKKAVNYLLTSDLLGFKPKHKVEIKEIGENDEIVNEDWLIKSYPVRHSLTKKCLAFRIESAGKILAYSGDTEPCLGLINACKNADLAIIEASWPLEMKPQGHMSAESAAKSANEAKVKKLVLSHISPSYLKNFDLRNEAKKFYSKPVIIAKDGMRFII